MANIQLLPPNATLENIMNAINQILEVLRRCPCPCDCDCHDGTWNCNTPAICRNGGECFKRGNECKCLCFNPPNDCYSKEYVPYCAYPSP